MTKRTRRGGGSSVEFALVLPILVVLLLGFLETGWIFYNHGILVRAVRAGCRAGAVESQDGNPLTTANDAIAQLMTDWRYHCPSGELCDPDVTLVTDAQDRSLLACRVSVPVASLTGTVVPVDGLNLTAATRHRVESWSAP